MHGIAAGHQQCEQGVARLVVGGTLALGRVQQNIARGSECDLLHRFHEILGAHGTGVLACRAQRGLVDQIAQLGTHQTRGLGRDTLERDIRRERHVLGMHLENRRAASTIRSLHHHATVEAAWSQQCLVQHVRAVGGREDDDPFARIEAVHLGQDLVQCLLALIVTTELCAAAARTTDGVQLIDEDDRRRSLACLFEQIADSRGANAHDHFDELGGTETEERDTRLAGNRARQQGLAGAGCTDQQHALRHGAAESLILRRILQEIDDFDKFVFRFIDPGNIVERDLLRRFAVALGAAATKAEQSAPRLRGTTTHPHERPDQQQGGPEADQQR